MGKWIGLGLLGLIVIAIFGSIGSYNKLVSLEQQVRSQWGQVENVYQRRADLVPNLVETVKGAASFEKDTFIQIAEARAKVGQVDASKALSDPETFEKFQRSQAQLSSSLRRLLVVAERYPELKATQNFRDLQVQLEGTENRIAVERKRFNDVALEFNSYRNSFPTVFFANFFGSKFAEKPYFKAQEGADIAPKVKF